MITSKNKYLIFWLSSGIIMLYLMILVGGITRLTESGLSMVEWHPITGILPPLSELEWNQEFIKYKNSPEGKIINTNITLESYKFIFFWEYIHRLLGRIIGLLFIIPFVIFIYRGLINKTNYIRYLILLGLGFLQGLVGWYMVQSGLVNRPEVSHYRLALHFFLALIIINYTFWIILDLLFPNKIIIKNKKYFKSILILTLIVSLQILYGTFVAGLNAGYLWNTFPLINNHIIPFEIFSFSENIIVHLTNDLMTVQFIHRILAIILLAYTLFLITNKHKYKLDINQNSGLNTFAYILSIQFIIGVLTLTYRIPLILGLGHQFFGGLLISICIYNIYISKYRID